LPSTARISSAPAATTTGAATRSSAASISASSPGASGCCSSACAPCTAGPGGDPRRRSRSPPRSPRSSCSLRLASALERGALLLRHRVGVLRLRERAAAHLLGVAPERVDDRVADLRVPLDEAGRVALVVAEHVVPDEYLAVGVAARSDADRRHGERPRCSARDRSRNRLEHDREAARRLELECILDQLLRAVGRPALRLE